MWVLAREDWVILGGVALYKIAFKDGIQFPIPKLVRDVLDHYEIFASQLMPNTWRILMSLEYLSMRHRVVCVIGTVLYSYYLKVHDIDKGWY